MVCCLVVVFSGGAWVVWYWLTMKVCSLKFLSIKGSAPIIERRGKVSSLFPCHLEAINQGILKMPAMDAWGKGLTDNKRRVGWEIWCLDGLALFSRL